MEENSGTVTPATSEYRVPNVPRSGTAGLEEYLSTCCTRINPGKVLTTVALVFGRFYKQGPCLQGPPFGGLPPRFSVGFINAPFQIFSARKHSFFVHFQGEFNRSPEKTPLSFAEIFVSRNGGRAVGRIPRGWRQRASDHFAHRDQRGRRRKQWRDIRYNQY